MHRHKTKQKRNERKKMGEKQSILGELCQSNADEPTNDCTIHRQSNGTQKMWWKWRVLERKKKKGAKRQTSHCNHVDEALPTPAIACTQTKKAI